MQANAPQRQSQSQFQTPVDPHRSATSNMENSQASSAQPRSSSGSVRPHGSRSTNPDKQISQIEKSVTHLLVATKQLLETLTQWSRGNAQEEEVSDVYVRLGYEFNLACRAFNSIGVETSDLGPVPDLLRSILEDTLSQPASAQALDNYLPRIRDIIINLLHGLKRKQSKLRGRSSKDGASKSQVVPARQSSAGSVNSNETGLTNMMESVPNQTPSVRSQNRPDSSTSNDEQAWSSNTIHQTPNDRTSIHQQVVTPADRQFQPQASTSSSSSVQGPTIPTITHPNDDGASLPFIESPFSHVTPPPPKQDALIALQRGGDLERRASRRFSAYQISKHLGASTNGVPVIPPAQNSPIPNRGREVRESMSAVRSRTLNQNPVRQRSANRLAEINSGSPRSFQGSNKISEERDHSPTPSRQATKIVEAPSNPPNGIDSPTVKTPEEYEESRNILSVSSGTPVLGATSGPLSPAPAEYLSQGRQDSIIRNDSPEHTISRKEVVQRPSVITEQDTIESNLGLSNPAQEVNSSPIQGKELTLFLQYKSKIKKFVLSEEYDKLSIARLQLAFIEKFNWHTHNNGVELPEIYIQDPVSGVRHELEDLTDVKDRSVLVLNVELLDEVKKHFDEGIGGLKTTLEGVRSLLDGQGSMMQRFSDRQLESAKEMARLSATPAPRLPRASASTSATNSVVTPSEGSMAEVQNLRRDIAVLRQTYSTMSSDFAAAMKDIKAKAEGVKHTAQQAVAPSYEGDAGRTHVNAGKKMLSKESELLVSRVDDLSDAIEDLRKDVVTRGVRPLPRQLEELSREISATAKDLAKMKDFMKREKPIWTKIWEQELNLVCTERDDLTQQEELMADLDGDLEDVTGVFQLVEEATKQQNLQSSGQAGLRSGSKAVEIDPTVDPQLAKDGVLGEVRALQPNHESRLEAIERAEKLRQKELESRKGGEFQREVEKFVEEGKLKKTGGMEEVERLRKIKDERARKDNFETQQARKIELAEKRARQASAATAAVKTEQDGQSSQTHDDNVQTTEETHATSQEDEQSFQDASEGNTSNVSASAHDSNSLQTLESAAPHQSYAEANETHHHSQPTQDLPALPEIFKSSEEDKKLDSKRSSTPATSDQQSWWKPAIFNP